MLVVFCGFRTFPDGFDNCLKFSHVSGRSGGAGERARQHLQSMTTPGCTALRSHFGTERPSALLVRPTFARVYPSAVFHGGLE